MWGRRRRERRSRENLKDWFWVDTDGLDIDQTAEVCRAALGFVRSRAERLQTDVPWVNQGIWPPEVFAAASVLAPHLKDYELTGWITPITDEIWEAYMTFAPFAFGSDVWDPHMRRLADVDDEAYVIAIEVLPDQVEDFTRAVLPGVAVPYVTTES